MTTEKLQERNCAQEEKKDKNVELLKRYIREAYPQGDALIGFVDDILTTAMQRAYEAGVSETIKAGVSAIEELNRCTCGCNFGDGCLCKDEAKALTTAVTALQGIVKKI